VAVQRHERWATGDHAFHAHKSGLELFGSWTAGLMREVRSGDFSGSGKAEIALFYDYPSGEAGLWLFWVTDDQVFHSRKTGKEALGPWGVGRIIRSAVGDFSGSGKAELAVFYDYPSGDTGLWLFWATEDHAFHAQRTEQAVIGPCRGVRMSEIEVGRFSGSGKAAMAIFYDDDVHQTSLWVFGSPGQHAFQKQQVWQGRFA
jgi:hypothetical protein